MKKKMIAVLMAMVLMMGLTLPILAGTYTVQQDDVLWRIARDHGQGATWQEIANYNDLRNPHLIFPGQVLRIPSAVPAPVVVPAPAPTPAPQPTAPPTPTIAPLNIPEYASSTMGAGALLEYVDAENRLDDIYALAEAGDADAQMILGLMNHGTPFGYEMYLLAAKQGNTRAMSSLGNVYLFGSGVEQSDEQAYYWWNQSAALGNAKAQGNLVVIYANGRDNIPVDLEKAYMYSRMAAEGGLTGQFNPLGNRYYNGIGVAQSYERAYYWFSQNKIPNMGIILGGMYRDGRGTAQDFDAAIYWFEAALTSSNAENNDDFREEAQAALDELLTRLNR